MGRRPGPGNGLAGPISIALDAACVRFSRFGLPEMLSAREVNNAVRLRSLYPASVLLPTVEESESAEAIRIRSLLSILASVQFPNQIPKRKSHPEHAVLDGIVNPENWTTD